MDSLPILSNLEERLQKLDVSKLVQYTAKLREIGTISKMMAPVYLRDFIVAYDTTNTMYSSAIKIDLEAQSALDAARSIAYLDKAGDWLKQKDIKDTSEARKQYIDRDPDVLQAAEMKAKTTALCVFLKNKMQEFRMAHDDVKKMSYGDNYMSPEEGY
jgi:hypothetical protein